MGGKTHRHPVGALCRSRTPIVRLDDEERSRVCRIAQVVPADRWHDGDVPEYEVELLAIPVTAQRKHDDLDPLR